MSNVKRVAKVKSVWLRVQSFWLAHANARISQLWCQVLALAHRLAAIKYTCEREHTRRAAPIHIHLYCPNNIAARGSGFDIILPPLQRGLPFARLLAERLEYVRARL